MNQSYAVFGLGRYGKTVAQKLVDGGADVIAIDSKEEIVEKCISTIPICKCADVTNKEVLQQLGISSIDTVIIAMAGNLEASVMATMLCKELGVPRVIVKCSTEFNEKILLKVGADKVVIPENESGIRLAKSILNSGFVDVMGISDDVFMFEMKVREEWIGKNLIELNLRKKYSMNIVAIKAGDKVMASIGPQTVLEEGMILFVIAEESKLSKLN